MDRSFYISSMIPSDWRPLPNVARNKAKFVCVMFGALDICVTCGVHCAALVIRLVLGDQDWGEGDKPRITDTSLLCTLCHRIHVFSQDLVGCKNCAIQKMNFYGVVGMGTGKLHIKSVTDNI